MKKKAEKMEQEENRHSGSLMGHGNRSAFQLTANKDFVNLGSAAGFFNPLKYGGSSAHSTIRKNLVELARDISPNIQMINMNIGMSGNS